MLGREVGSGTFTGSRFSLLHSGLAVRVVQINGAAAHLAHRGDKVIIAAWATLDSSELGAHVVPVVVPGEGNLSFRMMEYRADLVAGNFEIVDLDPA